MNTALLHIDTGDTAWVLISAVLVFLMTPGLAFYIASFAPHENESSILTSCFMTIALVMLQWVIVGYSLAFGPDIHGSIGSFAWTGMRNVLLLPNADYSASVPHIAIAAYQGMIAVFASTLILSAQAERIRFRAFILFTLLWTTLVFDPVAHWIWGAGGFLRLGGALDFGGGAVVHVNAGVAALVTSLVFGKRRRYLEATSLPRMLPMPALGGTLLWMGAFGLTAGNALGANGLAANAVMTTQTAAVTAGLLWALLDRLIKGKPTLSGIFIGVIGGLVAITPAAGFVTVAGAIGIGASTALFSYALVGILKYGLDYDDSIDAFGVYLISAVWGVIATGLWSTRDVNVLAPNGLFYGNASPLGLQIKMVLTTVIYSFVMTYLILKILDLIVGMRVREPEPVVENTRDESSALRDANLDDQLE